MATNRRSVSLLLRSSFGAAGIFCLLSMAAPEAAAQLRIGPQLAIGSDSGLGIGPRLSFPLRFGGPLDGVIDALYSTPSGTDSWIQTNVNLRLALPLSPDFITTVGAGMNASFISREVGAGPTTDTDSSVGLNVLGGIAFPPEGILGGRARPFAELRAVLSGQEEVVLTFGLTFGGPPEASDR